MKLTDINEAKSDINSWDKFLHLHHHLFSAPQHMRGAVDGVSCYLFFLSSPHFLVPGLPSTSPSAHPL